MANDNGSARIYVADTHALYWFWYEPSRLGRTAEAAFRAIEARDAIGVVPLIVIAELHSLTAKFGRGRSVGELLELVDGAPSLRIEGMTRLHLMAFDELSSIPEMHDRFIAAIALQLGAPVITRDRLLSSHPLVQTVW